jgi:LmbE family N-acetylglucosaminyl deacetylase
MTGPILVLAPHPDDEVVGFAARIARRRAMGARIEILFLTDGIPPAEALWPWSRSGRPARVVRRRAEAEAVARRLGVVIAGFLDIPSRRLKDHLAEARDAVRAALARGAAGELWVPAYEGAHQDHDAANFLASRLGGVAVWEAPLYGFAGGEVRRQEFLDGGVGADVVTLTAEERQAKRDLLAVYASERGNLDYVGCEREALRPLAAYDYSRPPHPGKTFYQRFQWVPFRHPRVDFTTPEEVCRALAGVDG